MNRLLEQLAVALAVAAIAVPVASATDYDGYKSGYPELHAILAHRAKARPVPITNRGFDRRDAAIGAATAAGLIFLLAGGGLFLIRRRVGRAPGAAVAQWGHHHEGGSA